MVDLLGVDPEFLKERRLVVEAGTAASANRGRKLRRGGEGCRRGGGGDIEGEEGEARVRGSRGLERGSGEAALLRAGGGRRRIPAGRKNHRRHVEFLRHGSEIEDLVRLVPIDFFLFYGEEER